MSQRTVESDLKAGAWDALTGNADFLSLVPAESIYSGSIPDAPGLPYASLECKPLGKDFAQPARPGDPYIDKRLLTVKVWAEDRTPENTAAHLSRVVENVLANESWPVDDSDVMAVWLGDAQQQEDGTQNGNIVWRSDIPLEVWLNRTIPGGSLTIYMIEDRFSGQPATPLQNHVIAPTNTPRTSWSNTFIVLDGRTPILTLSGGRVVGTDILFPFAGGSYLLAGVPSTVLTGDIITPNAASIGRSGFLVRLQDTSNYWLYELVTDPVNAIQIVEVNAGVGTIRSSATVTISPGTRYRDCTAIVSGNNHSFTVQGVNCSFISASLNSQTRFGISVGGNAGGSGGFDNFRLQ